MAESTFKSKTGNAPIVKQGHTATDAFGANPSATAKQGTSVRDLSVK